MIKTDDEKKFFKGFGNNPKCYEEIEILFNKNQTNTERRGFLRNQQIISQRSKQIDCESFSKKELIIDNKIKISKINNVITISNYSSSFTKFKTRNKKLKNIFQHHSYLTNGTDLIEDLDEITHLINGDSDFDKNSKNTIANDKSYYGYFLSILTKSKLFLITIIEVLFSCLIIVLITLVIIYILTLFFPFMKNYIIGWYNKYKFKMNYAEPFGDPDNV